MEMPYESTYRQIAIPITHENQIVAWNIPPPTSGRYSKIVISDAKITGLHLRQRASDVQVPGAHVHENVITLPDTLDIRTGNTSITFTVISIPLFKKVVLNVHKESTRLEDFYA
jgi:hypothetical protein